MRDSDKLPVLVVIWGVVGVVLFFSSPDNQIPLAVILGIAAAIATGAITGALTTDRSKSVVQQAEKAKRGDRIDRLMEVLDEDTLDELEDMLEARRGRLIDDRER